jgi:stage V sporulation protein G
MQGSKMEITEVQISLIKPREGLVAFASVVISNAIYLGSIGIHKKFDGSGYRLTYPTRANSAHKSNIYHPINSVTSKAIEDAILSKFKDVIRKGCNDAGYGSACA